MTIATLTDVLQPALAQNHAIAGLVVLGWEDALAYVAAAETEQLPIILQAGPGCRRHTPLPILATMFRQLAEQASVPIVCHLDHGQHIEECKQAVDLGFSSVMFDGSRLPLAENIELTAQVVDYAHAAGVSVEGEIGFVGYAEGEASALTNPDEAAEFARASSLDAMAISVGNVHLQQEQSSGINILALQTIEAVTEVPLVLHGGSGIATEQRIWLAQNSKVCKFNIGTELRMAFGQSLRQVLADHPERFDRLAILKDTMPAVQAVTQRVIRELV